MNTPKAAPVAVEAAVFEALPNFQRQDDYFLAGGASVMSENCHEIIHVDTLRKIIATVRAELASPLVAPVDALRVVLQGCDVPQSYERAILDAFVAATRPQEVVSPLMDGGTSRLTQSVPDMNEPPWSVFGTPSGTAAKLAIEEARMRWLADYILASNDMENESRIQIAYAIARHLKMDCPCAYEGRPQEVAEVTDAEDLTEAESVSACLGDDAHALRIESPSNEEIADNMERAAELLDQYRAASRVPVALGARSELKPWLPSFRDHNFSEGDTYQDGYSWGWNDCLRRIKEQWERVAMSTPTPAPGGAGGDVRSQGDSVNLAVAETKGVQT